MKRFTMFLSAVIFFTCTALVIEAKKKKSSEVNSTDFGTDKLNVCVP